MGGGLPKVLGHDIAGEIVEAGASVKEFKVGDEVFGMLGIMAGAYAEYVRTTTNVLALKPDNITMQEAAAIPLAALTSLQALRNRANIEEGQRVLITGGSGGVGLYAIQLAKHFGAHVTTTCSKKSFELVKGVGADHALDYHSQDFTKSNETFDIIYDCVGAATFSECAHNLTKNGIFVSTITRPAGLIASLVKNPFSAKKDKQVLAVPNRADMKFLKQLLESGELRAIIDKNFSLADLRAAHEYSETGRAKGKITIQMV